MSKKKEGKEEEEASKWVFDRTAFTEEEKRKLLGKVVEIAVRTTFRNHLYQFEGKFRIQAEGGAIGLRLTGIVARIVMDYWATKFREMARENNITLYLMKKYVDDVNVLMEALGCGIRWNGEKMEWKWKLKIRLAVRKTTRGQCVRYARCLAVYCHLSSSRRK